MGRLSSCVGIILAGGQSRRFGSPKAWVSLGETTFVERLYDLMNGLFEKTYVVIHEPEEKYAKMNTFCDLYPEGGPMNGIYSALVVTQASEIFVCACDLPNLQKKDIERLLAHWDLGIPALVYRRGGRWEPLCGIYARQLIPNLLDSLEGRHFSLQEFLTRVGSHGMEISPRDSFDPLINVNTPEDYQALKVLP